MKEEFWLANRRAIYNARQRKEAAKHKGNKKSKRRK